LTWRVVASAAIFVITLMTTGEMELALTVTSIEFPVKLLLYYLHERVWQRVPRGTVRSIIKKNKA
jgi:Predicted membrane protein